MFRGIAVGALLFLTQQAGAAEPVDDRFTPGYRYYQTWIEDSRHTGGIGVDVGWAAIHPRGFEVDLGTGLRAVSRHNDALVLPAWTANIALTTPKATAPYLELGFDLGEAVARNLLDWGVEDRQIRERIQPDSWGAAGIRVSLDPYWALKVYYKQHFIDGALDHAGRQEVWGVALVRRMPRKRLPWWQLPL